jgi:hypothetical protein
VRRCAYGLREHVDEVFDPGVQVIVVDLLAAQHATEQADELLSRPLLPRGLVLEDYAVGLAQRRIAGSSSTAAAL